jgi:hypothetical protein
MVIRLSPALEERIERAAKEKGVEPEKLVEEAVQEYLAGERQTEQISEARRQLDDLLQHMKKPEDFVAEVRAAKKRADKLYEDNAEAIEQSSRRFRSGRG